MAVSKRKPLTQSELIIQCWGELDAKIGKLALVVPLTHEKDVYLYGKNVKNAVPDGWRGTYDLARISVK